jgi:hypothetical protein
MELFDDDVRIVATETKLSGSLDRLDRPLGFRERVILVIDATVSEEAIKSSGDGPIRKRTLKLTDAYELEGERGVNIVNALRGERRKAEDEAAGRNPIPGLEDFPEVTTDGSGVVATPSELAKLAGAGDTPTEPWPGYDSETVPTIVEALENTKAAAGAGVGFAKLCATTLAFEEANGARKRIVTYCRGVVEAAQAEAVPPLPGEDEELDEDLDAEAAAEEELEEEGAE